ncbi:MAG: hypothetical protein WCK84_09535 [Bacteroidota bacterium]
MAGSSSCRKSAEQPSKTEFYLINNTQHRFVLYYLSENLKQDTIRQIAPHTQCCIWKIDGIRDSATLKTFIDQRLMRLMDENNVDWLPRISDAVKWGNMRLPFESGTRDLFFILMNPIDDGWNRLQSLGIIKLFRISEALSYLILLSSVIGLFYVRLRFKILYIILAAFLNYPVIYYTADFGYLIRNTIDPLFIIPTWVVESTRYYVRFSIPSGAIMVWVMLILRKCFKGNKN